MVLYPLLNHDDLRRWRACSRRFWLYRRSEHLATSKLTGREVPVKDRADDLFQIARAHYYHPVMAGSWSFKSISRAVAPDVTLALNESLAPSPQAAFANLMQRGLEPQTRQQLRAALQSYDQPPCHPTVDLFVATR